MQAEEMDEFSGDCGDLIYEAFCGDEMIAQFQTARLAMRAIRGLAIEMNAPVVVVIGMPGKPQLTASDLPRGVVFHEVSIGVGKVLHAIKSNP